MSITCFVTTRNTLVRKLRQFISLVLIATTCNLAQFVPANAAMVTTGQLVNGAGVQADRERLKGFLARVDVRTQLEQLGVDPADAQARMNAMTDQEIQGMSGKINQLPAGGDVLGVLVFIFVLLLITDILGLTKIFPFTRPIR